MISEKTTFLKSDFIAALKKLKGDEKPQWGVLGPQQMIEHMTNSFREANGKKTMKLHTAAEQVDAYKKFMLSDKEFKPNTKNALMSDTPPPMVNKNIEEALNELEKEINDFFIFYNGNEQKTLTNPFFGELNYSEWVHLLHKHARHHLKQYALI